MSQPILRASSSRPVKHSSRLLVLLALALCALAAQPARACGPDPGGPPGPGCGSGPAVQANNTGVNVGAGNPINVITGNKYQREVDLPALPGVLGLELVRHYNSAHSSTTAANGILGRGWRLSYESELHAIGNSIQIAQADGTRLSFSRDPKHPSLCSSADASVGQMLIGRDAQGEHYTWVWNDGRRLSFNEQGRLTQILAPTGEFVTLQHDAGGHLLKVTDPQGRSLQLNYLPARAGKGQRFAGVQSIDTPVGRYGYEYGSTLPAGSPFSAEVVLANLVKVALPSHYQADNPAHPYTQRGVSSSAVSRVYHYENARLPTLLTGISVVGSGSDGRLMNQRISTYGYDASGKANLSVKGEPARVQSDKDGKPLQPNRLVEGSGIEQVTLEFKSAPSLGGQPGQTVLQNSLGQTSVYTHQVIAGEYRLLEVRGAGCVTCGEANVRYGYDKLGRLVSTTRLDVEGKPTSSTLTQLDDQGRPSKVSRIAYADGKPQAAQWLVRYEYEATRSGEQGVLHIASQPSLIATPSVIAGQEHRIRIAYNEAGQPTRITEEGYSPLDEQGQPSAQGTRISRSTSYGYQRINGRSVLAQIDGPLANGPKGDPSDSDITRLRYDARGDQLTHITYPMGLTASFNHDEAGRVARAVGIDGVATDLRYESDGAVSTVESAGAASHLVHDANGRLSELIDPLGQRLRLSYDAASHLAVVGDAQNNRISLRRSTEGQLLQAQLLNPDGSVSQQRDFQMAGPQQDPVLAGMRRLIDNAEDNIARPAFAKPPSAALRDVLSASAAGQLDSPRDAMTTALDARGRATTYYRDDFGHLVAVQSPSTGLTRYAYNAAGQVTARQQADGSQASYARDAAGRVVGIKASSAQGPLDENATIAWGRVNKPSRITYLSGEERFDYDSAGRLTEHSQGTDEQHFSLKYRYDSAGRLLTKTLPDGQTLSYRYRGGRHPRAGLLQSVWLQSAVDRPIVEDLNSDAERYQQRSFSFGNGLTSQTLRDVQGRITQAGNAQVGRTRLRYADGAPGSIGDSETAPPQVEQIQSVQMSQRAQAEAAQRLIARVRGETSGWLATPNSIDPSRDTSPGMLGLHQDPNADAYDTLGRQTTQGAARFSYDSLNRLVEVKRDSGPGVEQVTVARYRYNVFGQRVAKVVYGTDGKAAKVTYFFYDGSELAAETSVDGNGTAAAAAPITTQYVHLNGKPVAMLKPGRLRSTSLYFVHTDHRNAPLALTDEARQVVWQAQVGDYGLTQVTPGRSIEFNLRASNQYFDGETGLHYNTNRYFDPVVRRYLTPDPLGLAVGPDLYAFAQNRPHEFSDPLGLAPIVTNDDVARASFVDKLKYVLEKAIPLVPSEIANELREMVQPSSIATVAAIFGVWAVAQLTPAGWIADVALVGIGYFFLGEAIIDLIKTVTQTYSLTNSATCLSDLDKAANNFAKLTSGAATSLGAAGAIKLARLFKRFFKAQKSGVWDLGPGPRGEAVEKALGHNVPPSYPKIDRWDPKTRVGTSIKSINLDDKTYLDPKKLKSRIKGMVDDLEAFTGANVGGLDTRGKIAKKDLEIVFPHAGTKEQQAAVKEMIDYARGLGIELRVIIMP